MNRTIGIFAHVDAGKTTLSEQILYQTNAIRQIGNIEDQNTTMDFNELEKQRGITIFSAQGNFLYQNSAFFLVDTPGHTDFVPQTERALNVIDAAVLVISATDGVQAHTSTLFKLIRQKGIPVFFFINKTDRPGTNAQSTLREIHKKLCPAVYFADELERAAAETGEELLAKYLDGGLTAVQQIEAVKKAVAAQEVFLACAGSALTGEGVQTLLDCLDVFTPYTCDENAPFSYQIYKTTRDEKKTRLTFLRITGGVLRVRDKIGQDQVKELRVYSGSKYTSVQQAKAGMLVAAVGLRHLKLPATKLKPALEVRAELSGKSTIEAYPYFQLLEEEEPTLQVQKNKEQITLHIMGNVQLEILAQMIKKRFDLQAVFSKPSVMYMETPSATSIGIGHYEPLRHYAEVVLQVEPLPRGSGIRFRSRVREDQVDRELQRQIRTHIFEKQHLGTTLGRPLTDAKITLLAARGHEKHTQGGDFREAVYRAIRHALRKCKTDVLEPYYAFELTIAQALVGRVLTDLTRMNATFGPPQTLGEDVCITGRVPVSQAADYSLQLPALSGGTGSISLQVDGYELCNNPPQTNYTPDHDMDNPCGSVFCKNGAGYYVPWNEVDALSHLQDQYG